VASSLNLPDSPARVVQHSLILLGLGTNPVPSPVSAWPVYSPGVPNSPENLISVKNTAGTDDGRVMEGEVQTHFGVQVMVRGVDDPTAWDKANAIREAVQYVDLQVVTVGAAEYLLRCYAKIGNVIDAGRESPTSRRPVFTLNLVVSLETR
jgi:hypothetical protein